MSDQEMRAKALELAVEVLGRTHEERVIDAARRFYKFMSGSNYDETFEGVVMGRVNAP